MRQTAWRLNQQTGDGDVTPNSQPSPVPLRPAGRSGTGAHLSGHGNSIGPAAGSVDKFFGRLAVSNAAHIWSVAKGHYHGSTAKPALHRRHHEWIAGPS